MSGYKDHIHDDRGFEIGAVYWSGGLVEDSKGLNIGYVETSGSGYVTDASGYTVGEVYSNGRVEDRNGFVVGEVRDERVYDRRGMLAGTTTADTTTAWVTGITDAHKAGAALLLLLKQDK